MSISSISTPPSSPSNSVESDVEKDILLEMTESRQDLFYYIKTDPKYYLELIEREKIGPQLNIIVNRDDRTNNLKIKYKIHPNDRWTEVGYFSETSDEEVIQEFVNQINHNIHRTPIDASDRVHEHLDAQLIGNNDMRSDDYMKDIEAIRKNANLDDPVKKLIKDRQQPIQSSKIHTPTIEPQPKEPNSEGNPFTEQVAGGYRREKSELEKYQKQILDHILSELPNIMKEFPEQSAYHYDHKILDKLKKMRAPEDFTEINQQLINRIENRKYIMEITKLLNCENDLDGEVLEFHRQAITLNPYIYRQYVDIEKFEKEYLEEIDHQILAKYSLRVSEIWDDYLSKKIRDYNIPKINMDFPMFHDEDYIKYHP